MWDPIMPGLTSFDGCSGSNGIWHEQRLLLLLLCLELRRIADRREVLFPKRDVIYFSPPPRERPCHPPIFRRVARVCRI